MSYAPHTLFPNKTQMSFRLQRPCRPYITRAYYVDQRGTALSVPLHSPTVSRYNRRWTFLSFSLAFIKVTFITCARAKMTTPHSGYTENYCEQLDALRMLRYNRFPHSLAHDRLAARTQQCSRWTEQRRAKGWLFVLFYAFNASHSLWPIMKGTH
jgi:hypothetical protein